MTGGDVNPRAAIALYFAAIFLGGCLIAPWIHHLMQALASPLPFLKGLADEPFRRYVTRSWMIIGALALWPFLKCLGANSLKGAGLRPGPRFGREIGMGFAIGFGSLAIIAALALLCGARELNFGHEGARYFKHMMNAVLAALLVPIIEEVFFRGAIFGGLRKDQRLFSAALVSSAIYAIVHFFQRSIWEGPVTWSSGLELLPPDAERIWRCPATDPRLFQPDPRGHDARPRLSPNRLALPLHGPSRGVDLLAEILRLPDLTGRRLQRMVLGHEQTHGRLARFCSAGNHVRRFPALERILALDLALSLDLNLDLDRNRRR